MSNQEIYRKCLDDRSRAIRGMRQSHNTAGSLQNLLEYTQKGTKEYRELEKAKNRSVAMGEKFDKLQTKLEKACKSMAKKFATPAMIEAMRPVLKAVNKALEGKVGWRQVNYGGSSYELSMTLHIGNGMGVTITQRWGSSTVDSRMSVESPTSRQSYNVGDASGAIQWLKSESPSWDGWKGSAAVDFDAARQVVLNFLRSKERRLDRSNVEENGNTFEIHFRDTDFREEDYGEYNTEEAWDGFDRYYTDRWRPEIKDRLNGIWPEKGVRIDRYYSEKGWWTFLVTLV